VDYSSILGQLSACADNVDVFALTAKCVLDGPLSGNVMARGATASLPEQAKFKSCYVSTCLLQRYHSVMQSDFTPLAVYGDGNCLFRAVSLALYGTEERHLELRAKAAIEIAMHREWYDTESKKFCAPFKDDPFVVLPDYVQLCKQVSTRGEHVGILCALALSAVCGCKIQMYFPPLNVSFTAPPLTQCLSRRNVVQGGPARVTIMWTSLVLPSDGTVNTVNINHFVPLLRSMSLSSTVVSVCVSDQSVSECEPCVNDPLPSHDDDDPAVDPVLDASVVSRARVQFADDCDAEDVVDAPADDGDDVQADDSDDAELEDHVTKKIRVDSGKDECVVPNLASTSSSFKSNEEVYKTLRDCTPADVLPEVPRGAKVNCSFVVNNIDNVQRKSMQQCNRFWDDCGAWDRNKGRTLTSTFVLATSDAGTSLRTVTYRNGEYCVKKRENKKVTWKAIVPAPQAKDVVVLRAYYTSLKGCPNYRKRITWLDSKPHIALVEYQGELPEERLPHGNAKQDGEYVRTNPKVMDSMRVALEHNERPGQVYENHLNAGNSFEVPRDAKQVRSLGSQVRAKKSDAVSIKKCNLADDIMSVINGVQDHDFIQSVTLCKGKSPLIIAYLPDQLDDMKRFCRKDTPASLRSVIGIDRTFNLGPCFVTTLVYKNMAVVRKECNDHPVFLGPVMLHFDAKTETYVTFFSHLSSVLGASAHDVHTELLDDATTVFGSDEEKAIVQAVRQVFHQSGHIFCTRHILENVQRHLADRGVDVQLRQQVVHLVRLCTDVTADTSTVSDDAIQRLLEFVRQSAAEHVDYFQKHVVCKLTNNMQVF